MKWLYCLLYKINFFEGSNQEKKLKKNQRVCDGFYSDHR